MHIWGFSRNNIVNNEQIYSDFSKIFPSGVRPKPPPKGKNQKLRVPQEAKAQVEVTEAGIGPEPSR